MAENQFRVVYDVTQQAPFEPEVAYLAAGLFALGLVWMLVRARQRKPRTTGFVLMGFASAVALIGVGLMSWDHARLCSLMESGQVSVVEGPVLSHGTERIRTARTDRREYHTYERFFVGPRVWFGYYWEVGQAGFHNGGAEHIELHDGLQVRATYAFADGTDDPPRILKLELAR
ncbi:MAG: hypothetical protein QM778_04555 [Myxococcales bacterium]